MGVLGFRVQGSEFRKNLSDARFVLVVSPWTPNIGKSLYVTLEEHVVLRALALGLSNREDLIRGS